MYPKKLHHAALAPSSEAYKCALSVYSDRFGAKKAPLKRKGKDSYRGFPGNDHSYTGEAKDRVKAAKQHPLPEESNGKTISGQP